MKDVLCHTPVDVFDLCNTLPRPADSNGIVLLKLKRKLQYRDRGHVYFESVKPSFILGLLQYLKLNNLLHHDIEMDLDNIPNFLINKKSQDSLLINV